MNVSCFSVLKHWSSIPRNLPSSGFNRMLKKIYLHILAFQNILNTFILWRKKHFSKRTGAGVDPDVSAKDAPNQKLNGDIVLFIVLFIVIMVCTLCEWSNKIFIWGKPQKKVLLLKAGPLRGGGEGPGHWGKITFF